MGISAFERIKLLLKNIEEKYNLYFCWLGLKKSDYTVLPIIATKEHIYEEYVKQMKLRWDDSPFGNAPVGMSIKTKQVQYSNNMQEDERFIPVLELLKKENFNSILSIPIIDDKYNVFGVFVAYSDKKDFFNEDIISQIQEDIYEIKEYIVKLFSSNITIDEKLNEYLKIVYDIITYINKGSSSNMDPKYLALDVLNELDKLLDADGSEIIIYDKTDNKLEFILASDLFLENFGMPSFDISKFGGLSPFVKHYMNIEHASNIDYEKDPYAQEFYIKRGLKFINFASINTNIYNKETSSILILTRKDKKYISEIELNILKLINQALFSAFVVRKYITDIGSLSMHLEEITTRDPLTGFYNRNMFEIFLEEELNKSILNRRSNSFSYILVDVDNFKYINDAYGYQFGDLVLKGIAEVLKSSLRSLDVIARIGGDEFGILMPDMKIQSAKIIMEHINEKLNKNPILVNGRKIRISLSAGISTYFQHDGESSENISSIKKNIKILAEGALANAKSHGKSSVVIANEKQHKTFLEPVYELISRALDEDLIEPAYQPILDLSTDKIFGFEALCRIKYNGNIIYPDQFIEEAESLGLINKIDLYMIEKSCKRLSPFKDYNLFVNISAKAFSDDSFFENLINIVKKYNMQNRLYVEITERESLSSFEKFDEVAKRLKYYGIEFVIDDFGSGYSSLLYLKFTKTNILKIDGVFVKNITNDRGDEAIVSGINFISKQLNVKTLAEFIEDENILEKLKHMGVDYGQGYYLGKPSFDLEKFIN